MSERTIFPVFENAEVAELTRILQLETAALIGVDGERIELPPEIHKVLKNIVRYMSQGKSVTVIPDQEQITTQKAANFLGMSRPHLIKLLDAKLIPFHKSGTHRRLYLHDVLEFAKKRNIARHAALNQLAKETFDAGLYEGDIPLGGSDE
jgi:excisionase family DNA binding protein